MAASEQELVNARNHAQARVARAYTKKTGSPEEATEARRALAAIKIEQAIANALRAAPPLSEAQKARLASLLLSGQQP